MSGYAALAERMSMSADLTSIRRFSSLNYQNLLYLQAELTDLEAEWRKKEKDRDELTDREKKYPSHDWVSLSKSPDWRTFELIQKKLKEYSERKLCSNHHVANLTTCVQTMLSSSCVPSHS